jgi:hypothetical protein
MAYNGGMFHHYRPSMAEILERDAEILEREMRLPPRNNVVLTSPPRELSAEDAATLFPNQEGEWVRIERKIHSPFWRAIHNLVAHPLLTLYRPLGEKLHDYTAERMYEDNGRKPEISDKD